MLFQSKTGLTDRNEAPYMKLISISGGRLYYIQTIKLLEEKI